MTHKGAFIEIKHNEFSRPPTGWDRNFDDDALEFINQAGIPIFQLVYGTTEVKMMGIFSLGSGGYLVANEHGTAMGQAVGTPQFPIVPPTRIFEYPSLLHKGQRQGKINN